MSYSQFKGDGSMLRQRELDTTTGKKSAACVICVFINILNSGHIYMSEFG